MKRVSLTLGAALGALVTFGAVLTARYESESTPHVPAAPMVSIADGAIERLAGAIRFPTISAEDPALFDADAFRRLHEYLAAAFPRAHAELQREAVATHSLLYRWEGSDSSLRPILLSGHLDVVPVEPGTEGQWNRNPFGGDKADGAVWGRGAIDNKSAVVGTLEAVEMLLVEGFRPARTVYLAYGHDEEIGGTRGARQIAALLESRGVELEMVLDEGGVISDGILPGVAEPVALIGVAEKGFVTIELSTRTSGGHSSLPPSQSAVGIVSAAVAKLEANPMPARLEGATRELFDHIGPRFPLPLRAVFANMWLTRPFVTRRLESSSSTNAMVRTTTAATIFQAGTKDNALPSYARAAVNFRILPGDGVNTVLDHVKRIVDDDRVEIRTQGHFTAEPSAVSTTESESYRALERTIRSIFPGTIVAPYLVVVVTDARHYSGLSRNVFRFLPLRLTSRDLERMHGVDERMSIREYGQAIRMYRELVLQTAG